MKEALTPQCRYSGGARCVTAGAVIYRKLHVFIPFSLSPKSSLPTEDAIHLRLVGLAFLFCKEDVLALAFINDAFEARPLIHQTDIGS